MNWTDNHCHLPSGADGADLVAEARAAGVTRLVTVGTEVEHSRQAIAVAAAHEGVWATAGVHPHDAADGMDGLVELLDRARGGGGGGVRARLPLRPLAAGRRSARSSPPRSRWPSPTTWRW